MKKAVATPKGSASRPPRGRKAPEHPWDKKIGDQIEGIAAALSEMQKSWGEMRAFAKDVGVSPKNVANYLKYDRHSNPAFREAQKILWGLRGFPTEDTLMVSAEWVKFRKSYADCPEFMDRVVEVCEYMRDLPQDYQDMINFALDKAIGYIASHKPPKKEEKTPWYLLPYRPKP